MRKLTALALAILAIVLAVWFLSERRDAVVAQLPAEMADATKASLPRLEPPADVQASHAAPSEPLRTVASAPPNSAVAAAPLEPLLRVRVLALEDRSPIPGARLMLAVAGHSPSCAHVDSSRGKVGDCPRTDEAGRAEFALEAGLAHEITVFGDAAHGRAELQVAGLSAAEQRALEILVPTREDVVLFGVLVDAETSAPVRDGKVEIEGPPKGTRDRGDDGVQRTTLQVPLIGQPVLPDEQGRFELHGKTWEQNFASVTARGYARTVFRLVKSYSDPSRPLQVRMARAAAVEFAIADAAGGPISGATVELTCGSDQLRLDSTLEDYYYGPEPRWTATSDARGQAVIEDLPPRVPLRLSARCKGFADRGESEPLTLAIGERRHVLLSWGTGGTIRGVVTDENHAPRARLTLWRRANMPGEGKAVLFDTSENPDATATADESGRFSFADVPAGLWLVGIAPVGNPKGVPALAQLVEVKESGAIVEVALEVQAGLMLRGRVTTPDGSAPPECFISAQQDELGISLFESQSRSEGSFELGPLPSGNWTVVAYPRGGSFASSEFTSARPGDQQLVLKLRGGGVISGRVLNDSGIAVESALKLSSMDGGWWSGKHSMDGTFRFDAVLPGKYVVWADDRAHAIGSSAVLSVEAGQTLEGIEIRLGPGAQLELRYVGTDAAAQVSTYVGGIMLDADQLTRGKLGSMTVPSGEIEVRWREQNAGVKATQSVTLAVGEVKQLTWDGKP